ncbi:MAG: hypothetical protein GY953_15920, partial [bacterium]|nr:hypothetical protein [bacterium]
MRLGRTLLTTLLFASLALANWPHWRGPDANGISTATGLPAEWGPNKNILWKAPLPGVGTSTPIVWGDQVFITMQVGKNPLQSRRPEGPAAREAPDAPDGTQFLVRSYSLTDGKLNWEYRFAAEGDLPATHDKHNLASPSCTTDGELLYAWMGTGQLVALTLDGKVAWKRHIGDEYA